MAKHAAVPKFGQWDNGNTGFTTRFEVARKGRGGGGGQKVANLYDVYNNENSNENVPAKAINEPKTRWKEDVPHVHTDASRQNPNPQRARNDDAVRPSENRRRPTGRFTVEGSQAPSGRPHQAALKAANPRQTAAQQHKAASVPKFGSWDEINSTAAGDGYTMQFDKLKKEREAGAHNKLPPISPQPESENSHNSSSSNNRSLLSKIFRCLNP
ncbi:RPM1-interacting protein 4-like [Ananas comosus]|uniref:RPM1-interacting protein 4-like n=2 Tax=Ananas comosus TaxID=4615 RepID=A0A6P5GPP5_ANACO|nr:RPM1-interacting protein 4-like [Ananas comosus]CAD1831636.1 unnamed protein product [Ananas comosus var. bracteatus]